LWGSLFSVGAAHWAARRKERPQVGEKWICPTGAVMPLMPGRALPFGAAKGSKTAYHTPDGGAGVTRVRETGVQYGKYQGIICLLRARRGNGSDSRERYGRSI